MFKVSVSSEEIRQDTLFKRGDKDGQKLLINAVSFSLVADISQKVKTLDPVLYDPKPSAPWWINAWICNVFSSRTCLSGGAGSSPPGPAYLVEQSQLIMSGVGVSLVSVQPFHSFQPQLKTLLPSVKSGVHT